MSAIPDEQQRARWDLVLLNLEHRAEPVRQLQTYEGRRLVIPAVTLAAVFAAGGVVGGLIVRLLSGHRVTASA